MSPESKSSKPTVLVLASTFPRWPSDPEPGFILELAKRLTVDWRVIVLCPHAKGAQRVEMMDGVEVIRYRYAAERWETLVNDGGIVTNLRNNKWKLLLVPGFVLMQALQAWRLSKSQRIDVVHAHWLIPQGMIAALLHLLPGRKAPFVVTSHGADLFALRGAALQSAKKFVLSRARSATVVSSAMRDIVARMGADVGKVSVIPMGVDMVGRFVPSPSTQRSNTELLFVGRLVEKKGLSYLMEALPQVLKLMPATTLTIAGFGPDEDRLKAQAKALGLQDRVQFLGAKRQEELPALYQRAALFVAPFVRAASGDQEGLPVALMEAVGCGCPALAGDVAGLTDIFGEHASDCVVDPRDASKLTAAIVDALGHPEAARERAAQMRVHLMEQLNWDTISARYSEVLRRALS